jgi:hypothetical protein
MSTNFAALPWSENSSRRRFTSGNFPGRFRAFGSFVDDFSGRIERQWTENRYWDRAAPTVFAVFMATLVAVLALSYAGVQIV